MQKIRACALLWGLSLFGCSSPVLTEDKEAAFEESCAVEAPTSCPENPPTYADVQPIFDDACNSCHTEDDPGGPWPLESYTHIVLWRSDVRDEVLNCTMPPRDAEKPLTPEQRLMLMEWIFCGFPR